MKFCSVFTLCLLMVVPLKSIYAFTPSKEYKRVLVELHKPSLVEMVVSHKKEHGYAPSSESQKAYTVALKKSHEQLIKKLQKQDIIFIKNFTAGINGIQCWVKKKHIHTLSSMPQVKGVRGVGQYKSMPLSQNDASINTNQVALNYIKAIGADKLHAQGFTGKGKTIAILDTGVNYYHKSLGGEYDLAASLNISNDPTIIEPGSFPNDKVIAGTDFGGTLETDENGVSVDDSDSDPISPEKINYKNEIDLQHGTMVAALAAGSAGLDVLPGVAPDAKIVAIKVFADFSSGFTDLVGPIEFALDPNQDGSIDDHVDVMNFSLGTDSGSALGILSERIALENAHALGVVVVAAAGNHAFGNVRPFSIATPSSWPSVISVGATEYMEDENRSPYYQAAYFSLSGPDMINASLKPDLSAPGVNIPFFNQQVDRGTSFSSPIVAGLAAVLMQKYPDFTPDQIKDLMVNSTQKVYSNALLDERHEGKKQKFAPLRVQGVGSIQAEKAFKLTSLASPSTLSFGYNEVQGHEQLEKMITVKNLSNQEKNYTAIVEINQAHPGVRVDVDRRFSVPANGEKNITLRMRVDAQQISQDIERQEYLEADGWVTIKEGDQTIRAGYLALLKPVSKLQVKPTKQGGVIISKNTVKSQATPYVAAQYQSLTYGNNIEPSHIDVPNIGVKINSNTLQPELEILVAYNELRSFAFVKRHPLTLNVSLKSEKGEFKKHITLSKDSDFLNYLDPNFAFIIDERQFSTFITVYNADNLAERLNGLDTPLENLSDQIKVVTPIFSRHIVVKIPLDDMPEGAVTFDAIVSARPHLYRSYDFKAKSQVSFDVVQHEIYNSQGRGKVASFKRDQPSQSVISKNKKANQILDYMWHLSANSASDTTGYASVVFEGENRTETTTDTLSKLIDVKIDDTVSIVEGTIKTTSMQITNVLDIPINILVDSFSEHVFPVEPFVTLLPNEVYVIDTEIDASKKNKGETIKGDVLFLRDEDGYDLGLVTYTVPVTGKGINFNKKRLDFNVTTHTLDPNVLIKKNIFITNTLNHKRELVLELPDLIQTKNTTVTLMPKEKKKLSFYIEPKNIFNNIFLDDVIHIKEVGSQSVIRSLPVVVDINGLPPISFSDDIDGVVTIEGKVGEPIDMFFFFEMGTLNPQSLPLKARVTSSNKNYNMTTTDETFENEAGLSVEVSFIPEKAGAVSDIMYFNLGAGTQPFEFRIQGEVLP